LVHLFATVSHMAVRRKLLWARHVENSPTHGADSCARPRRRCWPGRRLECACWNARSTQSTRSREASPQAHRTHSTSSRLRVGVRFFFERAPPRRVYRARNPQPGALTSPSPRAAAAARGSPCCPSTRTSSSRRRKMASQIRICRHTCTPRLPRSAPPLRGGLAKPL
jgi:hypothetical protein